MVFRLVLMSSPGLARATSNFPMTNSNFPLRAFILLSLVPTVFSCILCRELEEKYPSYIFAPFWMRVAFASTFPFPISFSKFQQDLFVWKIRRMHSISLSIRFYGLVASSISVESWMKVGHFRSSFIIPHAPFLNDASYFSCRLISTTCFGNPHGKLEIPTSIGLAIVDPYNTYHRLKPISKITIVQKQFSSCWWALGLRVII